MRKLYVYADFDWLNSSVLVGELSYESLRGNDSYCFCYDKQWLGKYGNLILSDDIRNYPGQQYTSPDRDIFGCFADALPDRWGRTLLNRREQIEATEEQRPVIRRADAEAIITEVTTAVSDWKTLASKLGIQKRESAMFEERLDRCTGRP